ncbi:hypothetical protein GCM10025864_38150 [Luteimicrobium album]|uniref:6-phosphogluconolactonase n=1 Tax=Luteimicrobium album TaxID=1054550 RepID=A0ABQ6I6Y8_9MICO|nr:hypothetical protein GCM10025864_38150 [Luteimicrobium album]
MTAERRVVVHPDADTLAEAAAARLLVRLTDLQSTQPETHVVLTGGTVGIKTLAAVAASPLIDAVDWSGVHLWWGDERFLPDEDADRNETQAREALVDELVSAGALPADHVHAMPPLGAAATPEESAEAYAAELARFAPDGARAPAFDVLLFGMGPDGHVASLFPGHPALDVAGVATVGVHGSPSRRPSACRSRSTRSTARARCGSWRRAPRRPTRSHAPSAATTCTARRPLAPRAPR